MRSSGTPADAGSHGAAGGGTTATVRVSGPTGSCGCHRRHRVLRGRQGGRRHHRRDRQDRRRPRDAGGRRPRSPMRARPRRLPPRRSGGQHRGDLGRRRPRGGLQGGHRAQCGVQGERQAGRDARWPVQPRRRRLHQRAGVLPAPGQALQEHQAEGVDVGLGPDPLAAHLLRREVGGRADDVPVPVTAVPSSARAIPKSASRGPSAPSSTFAGLRSRCTIPAPCTWASASASRAPMPQHLVRVQRPALEALGQRRPLDEVGDDERAAVLDPAVVQPTSPGWCRAASARISRCWRRRSCAEAPAWKSLTASRPRVRPRDTRPRGSSAVTTAVTRRTVAGGEQSYRARSRRHRESTEHAR